MAGLGTFPSAMASSSILQSPQCSRTKRILGIRRSLAEYKCITMLFLGWSIGWLIAWFSYCDAVLISLSYHYHRLGGSKNRNLSSHSSAGWKSKTKVPAGPVSGKISLPGLQMALFSLCLHMCEHREVFLFFLYGHSFHHEVPTLMT